MNQSGTSDGAQVGEPVFAEDDEVFLRPLREIFRLVDQRFAVKKGKAVEDLTIQERRELLHEGLVVKIGAEVMTIIPPAGLRRQREAGLDFQDRTQVEAYREVLLDEAMTGDAWSTRRLAEIYELLDDEAGAVRWWLRAAELGEPDAVLYVAHLREHGKL